MNIKLLQLAPGANRDREIKPVFKAKRLNSGLCFADKSKNTEKTNLNSCYTRILFKGHQLASKTTFRGIKNIEQRNAKYPADKLYREELAKNVGCKPVNLRSIAGPSEFIDIVKKLNPENFSVGDNFKNVNEGIYKADLHIHTLHSDGHFTVDEYLKQVSEYSAKVKNPPLIVTISDHDCLDGAKEAIRKIAEHPEKYENVLFVPGIEFSSKYINPDYFNKTIQLEVLGYCINPFDKALNKFVDDRKLAHMNLAERFIQEANKFGANASLKELTEFNPLLRIAGSPAFPYLLDKYLHHKGLSNEQVNSIFDKFHDEFETRHLTKATPSMEKIIQMAGTGQYGLAHPGRISLSGIKNGISGEDGISKILSDFKNAGGNCAEANYQYPEEYYGSDRKRSEHWIQHIYKTCEALGLVKTGGLDNHSPDLFVR